MKILIDIPEEFEVDYNTDRFAEFFHRCLADMGTCCGNYEQETAEMMEKAFAESRLFDPNKVEEQLEEFRPEMEQMRKTMGVSPITDTIYYGTVKNDMWVGKKEDVTYMAIKAVFEWFMHKHKQGSPDGDYQIRFPGIPYVLSMRKEKKDGEADAEH